MNIKLQSTAFIWPPVTGRSNRKWDPALSASSRRHIQLETDATYNSAGSRYRDWLRTGRPRGRSSSLGRGKNFLFSMSSRPVLRPTQLPIQWVPGALYPAIKRPERETDHSPQTSVEVKKTWIYRSTPHTPSWRDNFTLLSAVLPLSPHEAWWLSEGQ
jgi:hypothetical protein